MSEGGRLRALGRLVAESGQLSSGCMKMWPTRLWNRYCCLGAGTLLAPQRLFPGSVRTWPLPTVRTEGGDYPQTPAFPEAGPEEVLCSACRSASVPWDGLGTEEGSQLSTGRGGGGQSLRTGPALSEEKGVQSHGQGQAAGERTCPGC